MIDVKVGDEVVRNMAGVHMTLIVSEVQDGKIVCGPWTFDQETGAELDEDLGWDATHTGSYISPAPACGCEPIGVTCRGDVICAPKDLDLAANKEKDNGKS
jgi:hypothetical protein